MVLRPPMWATETFFRPLKRRDATVCRGQDHYVLSQWTSKQITTIFELMLRKILEVASEPLLKVVIPKKVIPK